MLDPDLCRQAAKALYAINFDLELDERAQLAREIDQATTYDELPEKIRAKIPAPTN